MATLLDLSVLQTFSILFPFLIVWVITFALLRKTHVLGDSPLIDAFFSFMVGVLVIVFEDVATLINSMIPWFGLVFVFLLLFLFILRIGGVSEEAIGTFVTTERYVPWVALAICIAILFFAGGSVFGQKIGPYLEDAGNITNGAGGSQSYEQNLGAIIFHPKVLALVVFILIAVFTVGLLSMTSSPPSSGK